MAPGGRTTSVAPPAWSRDIDATSHNRDREGHYRADPKAVLLAVYSHDGHDIRKQRILHLSRIAQRPSHPFNKEHYGDGPSRLIRTLPKIHDCTPLPQEYGAIEQPGCCLRIGDAHI